MPTKVKYYAADLSSTSTTVTTVGGVVKVTLTFTPEANSTYLFFASAMQNIPNTGHYVTSRLINITSGTEFQDLGSTSRANANTEFRSVAFCGVETYGANPGAQTIQLQYWSSNSAYSASIKEATIVALKKDTNDINVDALSEITTTSTTYVDIASASITLGAGNWLVMYFGTIKNDSGGGNNNFTRLWDGTNQYNEVASVSLSNLTGRWAAVGQIIKLSPAASTTYKVQWKSQAGTARVKKVRMIALKLDDFPANFYQETRTRSSTTSTTEQAYNAYSPTLTATDDYLVLGNHVTDTQSNSANNSVMGGFNFNGTSTSLTNETAVNAWASGPGNFSHFFARVINYTSGAKTFNATYRAESGTTVGISEGSTAVLKLTAAPQGAKPRRITLIT
jgi:hypothetical protein